MSTRQPLDWSPLGLDRDPIPGCSSDVAHHAGVFRITAATLRDAQDALRPIGDGDMIGNRANSLRTATGAVESKLGLVRVRYDAAALALTNYGHALAGYQDQSLALLRSAAPQVDQLRRALAQEQAEYECLRAMPASPERDTRIQDYQRLGAHRQSLECEVSKAKAQLQEIIRNRDSAADSAASAIEEAVRESGLNDTLWDHFKEGVASVVDFLDKHSERIGNILSVISLAMTVIAPFTGPLAPFLAVAAKIIGLVGASFSVYAAFRKGQKTGRWGEFAVTAAVAVLSGLAAFGLSKKLAKAGAGAAGNDAIKQTLTSKNFNQLMTQAAPGQKLSRTQKGSLVYLFDQTKQIQFVKWAIHDKGGLSYKWVSAAKGALFWTEEEVVSEAGKRLTGGLSTRPSMTIQRTNSEPMAVGP